MKSCLIGKKLGHSYSKLLHTNFGYEYDLVELLENQVEDFIKNSDYDSINVTIPYKSFVIPFLDSVSDVAKKIGAVNTIVKRNGKLFGYNTDYYGMRYMIKRSKIAIKNQTVMVLGTGGTSKTAQVVLESLGAKKVLVVSRTGEINYNNCYDYSPTVILNTTPLGMFPNQQDAPIMLDKFSSLKGVIDVIYNPWVTKLLFDANKLNVKTTNGLSMLVAQAKYAKDLFFGREINEKLFDKEIEREINALKNVSNNIVLIGMPGSGKSSVAKILSEKLGKEHFDSDEVLTETTGKTPKQLIEEYGEEKFRELESQVLFDLSHKRNAIISTGGGVVTVSKNQFLVKCSGSVVYIKRKLKLLDTTSRPLTSDKNKIKAVYKKRKKLYKQFCDYTVKNNKNLIDAVKEIIKNENFSN